MHIGLLHQDCIPRAFFSDFEESVRVDGLDLHVESYESGTPFASLEWLVPSAIVAFLAKPYFESFLTQMGKDHYAVVKRALLRMYGRVAGPNAPEVTVLASPGKVRENQPYSLFFSVIAEANASTRFKLLVPRPVTELEYEQLVSAFLDFMDRLHAGTLDQKTLDAFRNAPVFGGTILVHFDSTEGIIVPVGPTQARIR